MLPPFSGGNEEEYPLDFIHSQTPNSFPPHVLKLKKGAIVMLLRNINVKRQLCNGTRFIIREIGRRILTCEFISGVRRGERVALPRICFTSDEEDLPVVFTRHQFPVRVAFAMTIHKAQGQTFDKVAVSLPRPCFTHGQLYVAVSRVRRFEDLTIHVSNENLRTKNVVYRELLDR